MTDIAIEAINIWLDQREGKKMLYMNPHTGSVDTRDGWFYTDENGRELNAVDLGEVIPVYKTKDGWKQL